MWLNTITPTKFLCRYTLKLGTLIYGISFACLMGVCAIVILFQLLNFTTCSNSTDSYHMWKNAYALSVTEIIYYLFMVVVSLWFVSGVKKEKSSVVLTAVVLTAMRLAQMFVLMIVLLTMYMQETSLVAWIFALIFGLMGFCIPLYGLLVAYGYYLELKSKKPYADVASAS